MTKTILITGSTDGIGLEAAKMLAAQGHRILLHGRNPGKLENASAAIGGAADTFVADLSRLDDVSALAAAVSERHDHLDVLINNAGVYKTSSPVNEDGQDVRFVVNTIAPYMLTRSLLPLMDSKGRVVNLSSAAQAPVDLEALKGNRRVGDMDAYAQSKFAITMWSQALAKSLNDGPAILAVNPGSLLATKMVTEGFGVAGNNIAIGADIISRAAISDEFSDRSGEYFDNDIGKFAMPHAAVQDKNRSDALMDILESYANQN